MAEGKADDTIEWGDKQPVRRSWLARLTAEPPPERAEGGQTPRLRLNYPALVLTVLGFLAVLAGQYLPWVHANLTGAASTTDGDTTVTIASRTTEFSFTAVYTLPALTYGLSVLLVLAGAATMLTLTSPALRRSFAAGTLGVLAGQLAVLVGLGAGLPEGAGFNIPIDPSNLPDNAITLGPGYLLSVAAVALLAAALIVGGRTVRSRRTPESKTDDEPIDLVVTPLPGETVDIRSERPPVGG
jgi:hypothetical protein